MGSSFGAHWRCITWATFLNVGNVGPTLHHRPPERTWARRSWRRARLPSRANSWCCRRTAAWRRRSWLLGRRRQLSNNSDGNNSCNSEEWD
eukprot:8021173-Pyramimonas_sp.AAC.1